MGNTGENGLFISFDRGSVTLKLVTGDGFEKYKAYRKSGIFDRGVEPLELPHGVVTPDGYFYNIKGKISMKELILGEDYLGVKVLDNLLLEMLEAEKQCVKLGINRKDVIYDYTSVFVTNFGGFSFVVMPGAGPSNKSTRKDLMLTVFLNLSNDNISDYAISNIREMICNIEEDTGVEVLEEKINELRKVLSVYMEEESLFERLISLLKKKKQKISEYLPKMKKREMMTKHMTIRGEDRLQDLLIEKTIEKNHFVKLVVGREYGAVDIFVKNLFVGKKHAKIWIFYSGLVFVTCNYRKRPMQRGFFLKKGEVKIKFLEDYEVVIEERVG